MRTSIGGGERADCGQRVGCEADSHRTEAVPGINPVLGVTWEGRLEWK